MACAAPAPSGESRPGPPAVSGERAWRGFRAVRGERELAAENPDRLFVPASVHKLAVAAAALTHLGPDHRVTTEARAAGTLAGGILEGDLVLAAAGDPTWSERFFPDPATAPPAVLARRLTDAGLRRVTGDLVIDTSRFPGRPFPTSRPASEYAYGYATPTSALAVGESSVRIEIAPGPRIGAPGRARLVSGGAGGTPHLINRIRTVSKERHGVGTVDVLPVWESESIVLRGEYPVSEPSYSIALSVPSPGLHAARHLLAALERQGIEVEGEARLERWPVAASGPVLASFESPALARRLEPILTDSHNWHAEMLLLVLAAEVHGEGRLDEGLEIVRQFLEEQVGSPPDSFHLDDGSGLSPYNLISPRAVVALLRYASSQTWRDSFLAALPRNGEGTLEHWRGLPAIVAKTGRIRHTLALAGYLDPESPEPIAFAVFFNQRPGERGSQRAEIAALLRRWQAL